MNAPDPEWVRAERDRRWWRRRRPLRSIERAGAFVEAVGFALLFPARGIELPSLYEAAVDLASDEVTVEWGPDAERVWRWKDELPRRGLAWYGKFLRGRASLLSPDLLADLYPREGAPDDFVDAGLGPLARRIAEALLLSGPTSTAALREELGAEGRDGLARFSRALTELGRALVVTHFGTEERRAGWPAAVLELTARAFPVSGPRNEGHPDHAPARTEGLGPRLRAARSFLRTVVEAGPGDLAATFGWTRPDAREALSELAARSLAGSTGESYLTED